VPATNHRRGDLFGGQCRYEPGPNNLTMYPESPTRKVELLFNQALIHIRSGYWLPVATNMNQFEDKYKNRNFCLWSKEENNSQKTGENFS